PPARTLDAGRAGPRTADTDAQWFYDAVLRAVHAGAVADRQLRRSAWWRLAGIDSLPGCRRDRGASADHQRRTLAGLHRLPAWAGLGGDEFLGHHRRRKRSFPFRRCTRPPGNDFGRSQAVCRAAAPNRRELADFACAAFGTG